VLQQDPPAITLDQGATAVHATAVTMELGPPARRSTTARMVGTPAAGMRRALTLALVPTLAPAPPTILERGPFAIV